MALSSDNQYKGGLTFNSSNFIVGASSGQNINGGFNFDLPLATVAQFNSQSLDFTDNRANSRLGLVSSVINRAQNQADKIVSGNTDYQKNAMNLQNQQLLQNARQSDNQFLLVNKNLDNGFLMQNKSLDNAFLMQNKVQDNTFLLTNKSLDSANDYNWRMDAFNNKVLDNNFNVSHSAMQSTQYNLKYLTDAAVKMNETNQAAASQAGDSSMCFITTVVCEYKDMPDDCEILQSFRAFRDFIRDTSKEGKELVTDYYKFAPDIAKKLEAHSNYKFICEYLFRFFITPIFGSLELGDADSAVLHYYNMFKFASEVVDMEFPNEI